MTKKKMQEIIKNVAIRVAKADANATCPCITYQPKMPDAVKKMRKFQSMSFDGVSEPEVNEIIEYGIWRGKIILIQ